MGGLIRRMVVATGALLLIVGVAFSVLLISISDQRATARLSRHSAEVFATADNVHRVTVDVQTAQLQYTITRDGGFLDRWQAAQADLPGTTARLEQLANTPTQQGQARQITQITESYVRDYSIPTVDAARRGDASARSVTTMREGDRRIDELRTELDSLRVTERNAIAARDARSDRMADREIIAVVGGMIGSALVIALVGWYQTRLMIQPIRRAAVMAGRLAGGDFGTRMPEIGKAEIGQLERSFNVMAAALQRSHRELAELAETQTALRRVATLVARGVPPAGVMEAVAAELGRLIDAESVRIVRRDPDGTGAIVAAWGSDRLDLPSGRRVRLDGDDVFTRVLRTGRPARIDSFDDTARPFAAYLREHGVRSLFGAPILVEGSVWGAVSAATTRDEAPDAEARLAEYTDLIGTAIANTQARADLVTSRARFVLATDQARRRTERDLHDGVQQRLISLGLDVRRVEASVPPELPQLREQLSTVVAGLTGTVDEVREISRGVHPAILTEGGLRAALRALARRSGVAVDLDVRLATRLREPVEVAAYYVVAEALTNAAKHAGATLVSVSVTLQGGCLHLLVRDDGTGGADPGHGSGLIGLNDRVEALGGTMTVDSPVGGGTRLEVKLPLT